MGHCKTQQSPNASNRDVDIDVEILDRQRPPAFPSLWSELGFCFALLGSILMAEFFVSGFHIVLPPLVDELDIPRTSQTWPSSVFSLITGAFLLPFGRLGDMYGGYLVFNIGLAWVAVWSLVAGFSRNYMMLIFCRALQGFGSAAFLPSGIMILGKIYRPGPRKNLVFALYGAFAPLGFFIGILMVPFDLHDKRPGDIRMDWWGVGTIVPGLLLVIYAITDSSHAPQGWASPQIIVTLVLGVALLVAASFVEGRVASNPLLPSDLFAPKYMKRLVTALFLSYGTFGIFLFYSSFYIELVLHVSPLLTAVWYIPMIVGGLIIGTVGGFTLHHLPGRVLLVISGASFLAYPNYWAFIFPAMICATVGIDITYTVSNIFITNNLPGYRQGLAGALINSLLFLGISFFLGIADITVGETGHLGLRKSYQAAFWLGVGLTGCALVLYVFVKIGSAKSDLTVEEREQLEAEARRVRDMELEDGTSGS
ncbi:hypothetical protein LCI18_014864 [Fusarium solani-melongenae]|uniref:Uncharacterized protein n=1 Tax=Fusarium solani subsp. cucurbitae TaxID=2747967 RepID=A0ACD3ZRD7_FUSSC|nr:hypothetical protein LCI18_014864 [Fusarium solani-melongenae]